MKLSSIVIATLGILLLTETYFYLEEHEQYGGLKRQTLLDDNDPLAKAAVAAEHSENGGTIEQINKANYKQGFELQRHPCVRIALKPGGLGGSSIYCFKDDRSTEIIFVDHEGQ